MRRLPRSAHHRVDPCCCTTNRIRPAGGVSWTSRQRHFRRHDGRRHVTARRQAPRRRKSSIHAADSSWEKWTCGTSGGDDTAGAFKGLRIDLESLIRHGERTRITAWAANHGRHDCRRGACPSGGRTYGRFAPARLGFVSPSVNSQYAPGASPVSSCDFPDGQ